MNISVAHMYPATNVMVDSQIAVVIRSCRARDAITSTFAVIILFRRLLTIVMLILILNLFGLRTF